MNFDFLNLFKPKTKPITLITQPENEPIIRPEISPSNILFAKSQMDAGYYKEIYALFQRLIADNDNLAGCIDIRKEAAKACEYRFVTELSAKQEEFFDNLLSDFLPDLISQSIDLKLQGILFRQLHYKFQDNLYFLDHFESYKNLDLRLKNKKMSLYIENKEIALPELNFVFLHKENPVLESLLKYYCFFSFAINNWVQYTESYGKPVRIGKYQPGSSPKEINILKQMVASLGSDLAAVIPDNTLIEFVESQQKSASSSLYKDLVNFLEDRETRRILGETMSTKEAQNAGFAQSKVQDLVRKDVLAGDLADASRYVSWFLSRFNRINFADQPIRIELFPPKTVDLSQRINIDKQLNSIIDIDPDYFYKTYNIPAPKGGMKIKQTPAPITNSNLLPFVREVPERAMGLHSVTEGDGFPNLAQVPNLGKVLNRTYSDTSKAAAALKKKLQKLTESQFNDLSYLPELHLAFGQELTDNIFAAYADGRQIQNSTDLAQVPNNKPSAGYKPPQGSKQQVKNNFSPQIDWTLSDINALNAFRAEAFEVAHVHAEDLLADLKSSAAQALENGQSFSSWQKDLQLAGYEPENPYHLKTNFNTAINNSLMAGKWNDITQMKDIFPYLRYVAVMDDRVRDDHAFLNGTVAAVDDPFWDEFYPPNGWNCRCNVEQLTNEEGAQEALQPKPHIPIDENFQKNTGKELSIWGKWIDRKLADSGKYDWKDLNLEDWKRLPAAALQDMIDTTGYNKEQLLKLYEDYLEDRTVFDAAGCPIFLARSKAAEFNNYEEKDLQYRFQYLNCIDDGLQNPDEIWLRDNRYNYFKKYADNVMLVAEIEKDGVIRYFNIISKARDSYINNKRNGILIFRK